MFESIWELEVKWEHLFSLYDENWVDPNSFRGTKIDKSLINYLPPLPLLLRWCWWWKWPWWLWWQRWWCLWLPLVLLLQPCQNVLVAGNFATFSQFLAAYSTLDFTRNPLAGKGTWHLLPTTAAKQGSFYYYYCLFSPALTWSVRSVNHPSMPIVHQVSLITTSLSSDGLTLLQCPYVGLPIP